MAPAPKTATRSVIGSILVRSASGDALEGGRHRAAATEAQRGEAVPAAAAVELVEERRDDPGTARTDRVAERDRAAVDVGPIPVEAELATVGQGLCGERLVD